MCIQGCSTFSRWRILYTFHLHRPKSSPFFEINVVVYRSSPEGEARRIYHSSGENRLVHVRFFPRKKESSLSFSVIVNYNTGTGRESSCKNKTETKSNNFWFVKFSRSWRTLRHNYMYYEYNSQERTFDRFFSSKCMRAQFPNQFSRERKFPISKILIPHFRFNFISSSF